jgi:hypothetical protein
VRLHVAATVTACAAVLAPPASAGWLAPVPISPSDKPASGQAIALASDGRMVASWNLFDASKVLIQVAERAPGGPVEAPQTVSTQGVSSCCAQVAIDASGNATAMWIEFGTTLTYRWATRPAGASAFGAPQSVTLPGLEQAGSFKLRMSPAGEPVALLVTRQEEGTPPNNYQHQRVRGLTPSGSGALQVGGLLDEGTNSATDMYSFDPLDLDVDAGGTFYATWTKGKQHTAGPAGSTSAVRVAIRSPGSGAAFGAPEDVATSVSDSGDPAPDIRLMQAAGGVDAGGAFQVAYIRLVETTGAAELLLRTRPPGGGSNPGSGFNAGTETVVPLQASGPQILAFDVSANGTAVAAWQAGPDSTHRVIEACIRPPGGPCGAEQPLASGEVSAPVAAIGAGGDAVAAWRRGFGSASAADGSFARGGTFGPAHELDTANIQILPTADGTAVDPLGDAVVALERSTTSSRTIDAVVNDSAPPSIGALSVPPVGEPGEALPFGAAVTDVWSPFTTNWDFGDGSSAPGPAASHAYAGLGTFSAALTATDSEGNSATQAGAVQVKNIPPVVLSFGMTHRVFAVGAKATPLSAARRRRAPVGTTFRFRLSEAATARIAIQRKRHRRWRTLATLKRKSPVGAKRVPFSGRLRRKALRPGPYRAVLVAVDARKNKSNAKRLSFRVVRRR